MEPTLLSPRLICILFTCVGRDGEADRQVDRGTDRRTDRQVDTGKKGETSEPLTFLHLYTSVLVLVPFGSSGIEIQSRGINQVS